jgi:hypothetical protein
MPPSSLCQHYDSAPMNATFSGLECSSALEGLAPAWPKLNETP